MKYTLTEGTAYPLVEISLAIGEKIKLETGSMVYHNNKISLAGKINSNGKKGVGGLVSAIGRSMTSGERFFISQAEAVGNNGRIAIAPSSIGAIRELKIGKRHWLLNTGVFLACDDSVGYKMKRQKLSKAIFGRTGGLFVMKTYGRGRMLINSYGDIIEVDLDGRHPVTIDNEHVVAWEDSLSYSIRVASGLFGFTTGEGLVNVFEGRGKVLIQTRNMQGLANALSRFSPKSKK